MNVQSVAAPDRFDSTELSTEVVDGRSRPLHVRYTCPTCQEQVVFSRMDFETRGRHSSSNLSPDHAAAVSEAAAASGLGGEYYLDWYCPKCHLASRAYFRTWAGGRHGDSGIEIARVLELR
jgi:rubredoxin